MLTILIADDDPVITRILEKALTVRDYLVLTAKDGNEAWEKISGNLKIDIAILDWYMPGLKGPEITKKHSLLENSKFIYMIILSGNMEKSNIIEALHSGAHDVMEKPCDLKLLESRLKMAGKMVREKRALENMADTMQLYGEQMEKLANERAKQLVHAERMSSLGVMAAGIAHEINNPMSFISGNVQCLSRFWNDISPLINDVQDNTPDKKIEYIRDEMPKILNSIMTGVDRVTKIIKSLKKYSAKQSLDQKEDVNLNKSVEAALELCKSNFSKNTDFKIELSEKIETIKGSAVEIEQVLVNLLVNASQAMEGKTSPKLEIKTYMNDNNAYIDIYDNGCGIPEKIINKIWDPFVTTKAIGKGTGLGLSISSGIIKNHGGKIIAENITPEGAHFQVSFPLTASEVKNES